MNQPDYFWVRRDVLGHSVVRGRAHMQALVGTLSAWARSEDSVCPDERHPEAHVARGQLVVTERELCRATGIAPSAMHRSLLQLALAGLIQRQVRGPYSVITVPVPDDDELDDLCRGTAMGHCIMH